MKFDNAISNPALSAIHTTDPFLAANRLLRKLDQRGMFANSSSGWFIDHVQGIFPIP